MKKLVVCLCILLLAVCAVSCKPQEGVQPFGIEAGRQAWAQLAEPALATQVVEQIVLPEGCHFQADWGDWGVLVSQEQGAEIQYGVARDGALVLPCRYVRLARQGAFALGIYYGEEGLVYEVYDREGTCIVGTEEAATLTAVSEDYFVLSTLLNVQMFDAKGQACLQTGVLTDADSVSACGDYVLTHHRSTYSYCVWQLYTSKRGTTAFLRHRFADEGRYTVAYMGGRFLVTRLSEGTEKQYTYKDIVDGEIYYVRQQAWWYDADADVMSDADLDYVVLGIKNPYTPGIGQAEVAALHLNDGYSAVTVANINDYGLREGERYVVVDSNARAMVRYPAGITPGAIYYRSDNGFVGSSQSSGAAALYDLSGNMRWQNKQHVYATMQWQSGRLVASYMQDDSSLYGAFDVDGNLAVPFRYQYLSPYYEGYAVAKLDNTYYQINSAGVLTAVVPLTGRQAWAYYGVYAYEQDGKQGLCNLRGDVVVDAQWDNVVTVGINLSGATYVVVRQGNTDTLLVLE